MPEFYARYADPVPPEVLKLDYLAVVPRSFVFLALAAWMLTFAGMLKSLLRPRPALGH